MRYKGLILNLQLISYRILRVNISININSIDNSINNLLFWDLATVTYAHHSLIQGKRKGALYGSIATILLAVIFTGLTISLLLFNLGSWGSPNNYSTLKTITGKKSIYLDKTFNSLNQRSGAFRGTHFTVPLSSLLVSSKRWLSVEKVKEPELPPYWVTGFADAESSFSLKMSKKSSLKSGWNVSPEFRIDLHCRDLLLLRKIQSFFGVGTINQYESKNSVVYSVQSLRDIINVIIPHFDKYPLITQKRADYLLFKKGVELLNLKARSNIEGIREIVSIKASLNWGLSDTLRTQFPTVQPVPRPIVDFEGIFDPNWLAGFVDGEGYFYVKVQKAKTPSGFLVSMQFSITQHVRDELLLTKLIDYLGCGKIEKPSTRTNEVRFTINRFSNLIDKIIPFFDRYPLHGLKSMDFQDFYKVSKIMEDKSHLTPEGLKKIRSGMNKGRI